MAPSTAATDDGRSSRDGRTIGARTLLAITVSIPLLGLIFATWWLVEDTRGVSQDAAELDLAARNAEQLTRLDGALLNEMSVTIVWTLGDTLGIPPELALTVFGADATTGVDDATAATDALIEEGNLRSVESRLVSVRAGAGGMVETQESYGALRADVRDALQSWLDDLSAQPRVSTPELVREIELLEISIDMRQAFADAYYAYFGLVFDLRDAPAVELARLTDARQRIELATTALTEASAADPAAADRFHEVLTNQSTQAFGEAINHLIEQEFAEGVPERGLELNLANVFAVGTDLEAVALGANQSIDVALGAIDGQAETVAWTAATIRRDAERNVTEAYALGAALFVLSALVVTVAGRFVAAPLRQLAEEVDALHDGMAIAHDEPLRGPREVRTATLALRRAAHHFSLATEQARRLAAGELDAEELDQRVDGGLGDSLQAAVDRLRDALADQNEFRRRLSHEASHDGLTEVPNRTASLAHLTRALTKSKRTGSPLAVMFIDLDNFKTINDLNGHHAGDTVLTQVAQRLVNGTRTGDFVGRLGGDEFVVVTDAIDPGSEVIELAERILDALAVPIQLHDEAVVASASIGIAIAAAAHLSAEDLLRDADLALYRAKAEGRSRIAVCDDELRNQFVHDNDLANALERAITDDEFVLHFQPIVGAADHETRSLEALVRWARPDTGDLAPPGLFIEFAERSPLIVDIDRWVLEAVARQLAEWQQNPRVAGLPVSVNISGRHLLHPQLVEHVLDPLDRHGVDPELLIVELTESALVNDLAAASGALRRLRDAGITVAIDDFGTGYTSLAHLRALPVDILKIDRSFTTNAIADPGEASIVKLIIDAGHLLGATVTAEGIETVEEAERLAQLGTDHMQGFYFAKPQPAEFVFDAQLATVPSGAPPKPAA